MKIEFKTSYPTLWHITESNGTVKHHRLFELSILEHPHGKALCLIVLWWSVAVLIKEA